jgi:hypothetical protein
MNASLSPARRDELVAAIAGRVRAWNLDAPALLCLHVFAPLGFLGSQLLLFTQPFAGLVARERLARELAYLCEEPENIERLIAQLEDQDL